LILAADWAATASKRAKAEPLAKIGGKVVDRLTDLKSVDVLFSIVATGKDVEEVLYGKNGVCSQGGKMPPIVVDCSTIAVEESADPLSSPRQESSCNPPSRASRESAACHSSPASSPANTRSSATAGTHPDL
jgi:3-hydroxyisobutyrate dehydrogenase